MFASVILFLFIDGSRVLYITSAVLFGIGYGASYPVLAAMAANDAEEGLVSRTLQLFALTYFIGIFGFPFVAGWMIVDFSIPGVKFLRIAYQAFALSDVHLGHGIISFDVVTAPYINSPKSFDICL